MFNISLPKKPFQKEKPPTTQLKKVDESITRASDFLLSLREQGGYWSGRLDSNAGLNAQYLLLNYILGLKPYPITHQKVIHYILDQQNTDGSWSIYYGGPGHLGYSILCYFALKLHSYSSKNPVMIKSREFILSAGGLLKANVETRFFLALLDQISWDSLPPIPVQIMLAPNRFLFSIYNIAYWCRISLIPMSVIYTKKIVISPPKSVCIPELYASPPKTSRPPKSPLPFLSLRNLLLQMTKVFKHLERLSPNILDEAAITKAKNWILSHQDDSGDWGGVYPGTQYSLIALHTLGYPLESPEIQRGLKALEGLLIETEKDITVSASLSPVWDTAWAVLSLGSAGCDLKSHTIQKACQWLYDRQILVKGDWSVKTPGASPGGWCFQFHNDLYPDTDDTALVLMALLPTLARDENHEPFKRGVNWLLSMQNDDGGWGAFERKVDKEIINALPLNDIGNFLDPSTVDVTGRVIELLGKIGYTRKDPVIQRALRFLKSRQEDFGGWYGRWGVNYIYGTWSVLQGLKSIGEAMTASYIDRSVRWLKSCQNLDGGWGESCRSYDDISYAGIGVSTASQTAWAILALIAADHHHSVEAEKGINYLTGTQNTKGGWDESEYTGTGFEKAFYLKYQYYPYIFPLLALGHYRKHVHFDLQAVRDKVADR